MMYKIEPFASIEKLVYQKLHKWSIQYDYEDYVQEVIAKFLEEKPELPLPIYVHRKLTEIVRYRSAKKRDVDFIPIENHDVPYEHKFEFEITVKNEKYMKIIEMIIDGYTMSEIEKITNMSRYKIKKELKSILQL